MSATPEPEREKADMVNIELTRLRIPRYQRPEPDDRIEKLEQAWDDLAASALLISRRDNAYWIIDGQTRVAAARRRGRTHLPAVCCCNIDEKREAELFLKLNRDRLRVSAVSRHRAEVIAGEIRAIVIDEVLAVNGLHLGYTHHLNGFEYESEMKLHPIFCVVACERVYSDGGGELLDRVIGIIERCFPGDTGRYRGELVQGLGYFLARDSWGADDAQITKALSRIESMRLDEMAAHWQQVIKKKGSSKAPLYMAKAVASFVYRQNGENWKPEKP